MSLRIHAENFKKTTGEDYDYWEQIDNYMARFSVASQISLSQNNAVKVINILNYKYNTNTFKCKSGSFPGIDFYQIIGSYYMLNLPQPKQINNTIDAEALMEWCLKDSLEKEMEHEFYMSDKYYRIFTLEFGLTREEIETYLTKISGIKTRMFFIDPLSALINYNTNPGAEWVIYP